MEKRELPMAESNKDKPPRKWLDRFSSREAVAHFALDDSRLMIRLPPRIWLRVE
jgi:hypothetical protein